MTQSMQLLLVGTITGMAMTTAAIGTAAAAEPENRITILYDAFGKDASMRKDWGFSAPDQPGSSFQRPLGHLSPEWPFDSDQSIKKRPWRAPAVLAARRWSIRSVCG